jgi:hypothetical protein
MAEHQQIGDVKAALDALLPLHGCDIKTLQDPAPDSGAAFLVMPSGMKAESLKKFIDENRSAPVRVEGVAQLEDTASFIEYCKTFSNPSSRLFASDSAHEPVLVAVIDHHVGGPDIKPRFARHRAHYRFPLSDEWKAWNEKNGAWLPQAAFTMFLQQHITDVLPPDVGSKDLRALIERLGIAMADASRLVDLSKGLSVHVNRKAVDQPNLSSGEGTLLFSEEHKDDDGKPLKVPGGFMIGIPVFRGEDLDVMLVRLSYRVDGGKVLWQLLLHRPDRVLRDAFRARCESVKAATALPLFYGAPEA